MPQPSLPASPRHRSAFLPALSLAAALALTLWTSGADAHTGADGGVHHGFFSGFLHPITGLDHLTAMLGVGLWSTLSAAALDRRLLWAPLGFTLILLAGALLGFSGVQAGGVEPMIATSVLLVGLLAATRLPMPGIAAAALVGVFAVFHGLAHGLELAPQDGGLSALAGMALATLALHGAGMLAGVALRGHHRWLPRLLGAGIALFGASLLVA